MYIRCVVSAEGVPPVHSVRCVVVSAVGVPPVHSVRCVVSAVGVPPVHSVYKVCCFSCRSSTCTQCI